MSVYKTYTRKHLADASDMYADFNKDKPIVGGSDTESTGLHIKKDVPFLIVFGWMNRQYGEGRVYTFAPTPENMSVFFDLAKRFKGFIFHSVKFDLHMISNHGYEKEAMEMNNLVENMVLARLCVEAIPARNGGDSLKLKDLGDKYVDPNSSASEVTIKTISKKLKDNKVKYLAAALKQFPLVLHGEQQLTDTGKPKMWGKGAIERFLKDPTNDPEDLPDDVREVWTDWTEEHGDGNPTYKEIYEYDPQGMIRYAGDDVITMLEFARKAMKIVKERDQGSVLKRENNVILPLFRMERVGLPVDRDKLEHDRLVVKAYIKKRRERLHVLCGERVTCNQHKRIKEIITERTGITLESSDDAALKQLVDRDDIGEFVRIVRELRTLEKWYATYIRKIQKDSDMDGRFYTQINQASAVSGRVGSNSQQFPKKAIHDKDGNELFHPRKIFTTPKGWKWYFMDFSQVELRVMAIYTILLGHPDTNLCRAYMPYECFRMSKGDMILYDFSDPIMRKEWDKHDWYLNEKPFEKWHPTDVHAATTMSALKFLDYEEVEAKKNYQYKGQDDPPFGTYVDEKEFSSLRGTLGKRFNFSKNYGVGLKTTIEQLEVSEKVAQALIDGYTDSFPGVIHYQERVSAEHFKKGYVKNLFGRRFYLQSYSESYKLGNLLIQGSCADDLKEAIAEIDALLQGKRTVFVMTVHDELSFFVHPTEEYLVKQINQIMEKNRKWSYVPIVSDIEVTETNWYEKREVVM